MSRHLTDDDFPTDREKWEFLRTAPETDAREPAVQNLAHALDAAAGGSPRRFVLLAMAYCRDVLRYQSDTERVGHEDIQPKGELSDIIDRGVDDCDGFARLFCALCLARGIPAAMVPHWKKDAQAPGGEDLSHVSAEVTLKGESASTPVELTLYRARLGDEPEQIPKEVTGPQRGHWDKNEVKK